jgi:hypothetical protein
MIPSRTAQATVNAIPGSSSVPLRALHGGSDVKTLDVSRASVYRHVARAGS